MNENQDSHVEATRCADGRECRVAMLDITVHKQAEVELRQKVAELERINNVTVGRELRMIELKTEVNALLKAAGQPGKYTIIGEDA